MIRPVLFGALLPWLLLPVNLSTDNSKVVLPTTDGVEMIPARDDLWSIWVYGDMDDEPDCPDCMP